MEASGQGWQSELESLAYKITFPATHHERAVQFGADGKIDAVETLEAADLWSPWFDVLRACCLSDDGFRARHAYESSVDRYMAFQSHAEELEKAPLAPTAYIEGPLSRLRTGLGTDGLIDRVADQLLAIAGRSSLRGAVRLDREVVDRVERQSPGLVEWVQEHVARLAHRSLELTASWWI